MRTRTASQPLIALVATLLFMGAGSERPLIDAARNSDAAAMRALVQKGADVNAAEADGTTALSLGRLSRRCRGRRSAASRRREGERGERSGRHAAVDRQPERQRGDGAEAAGCGAESKSRAPARRNARDGRVPLGQCRRRRATARQGRQREHARRARPDGADVGGRAEASRCGQGAARARCGRPCPLGGLEPGDGRAAARYFPNTTVRSRMEATPR